MPSFNKTLNLSASTVPRIVWTYWHQGVASAPPLVQECLLSTQHHNPGWSVRVLDANSVQKYLPTEDLSPVASMPHFLRADRIRLALLRRYGGVWADATVLFRTGLNEWLPAVRKDGFFTFVNHDPDRIEYWFLAAHPGSFFIESLWQEHVQFFSRPRNHRPRGRLWKLQRLLERGLNQSHQKSVWWARWPLNRFPAYPYFIFCYLADDIIKRNKQLPSLWNSGEFPNAAGPAEMTYASRSKDEVSKKKIASLIEENSSPVYKLSHHLGRPEFWDIFLRLLEESH